MIKEALILLFSLFFFISFSAEEKMCEDTTILLYENYSQQEIKLPAELFVIEPNIVTDSIYLDNIMSKESPYGQISLGDKDSRQTEKNRDESNVKRNEKEFRITGDLFNILCHIELINKWDFYKDDFYLNEYDKFIEERKKELRLFYMGEVKIDSNYRSFLILVINGKEDLFNIYRDLYLMNVIGDKCQSLTRVASYTYFDGDSHYLYTKRLNNDSFVQKREELSSDVIFLEEPESEQEKIPCIKFYYDEQGMLKID